MNEAEKYEEKKQAKRLRDRNDLDKANKEMKNVVDSMVEAGFTRSEALSFIAQIILGKLEV